VKVCDGYNDACFDYRFGIYAYDVHRFLTELERLHASLEGIAELTGTLEESDSIRVSVADAGSGRLVLSGDLIPVPNDEYPSNQLGGILPFSGMRFQFDGLTTDQSCIPLFVQRMHAFFREADIDTSIYY